MCRHAPGLVLRRGWLVMAASLVTVLLATPGPTAAAEIAPRKVAFRVPGQTDQVRAWGPFTFGMAPGEADGAAQRAGGRMVSAGNAPAVGQPVAYHGPSQVKGGRHSRRELALVWFDGERLSRVTVMLFRLDLRSAEACLRAHRTAAASILPGRGVPKGAGVMRDTRGGSDEPGQRAGETGDAVWATEVQRVGSRAVIETIWEAPASAMQAGTDETCIGTITYLPTP